MRSYVAMCRHDCAEHGHAWRKRPLWGVVCVFCGRRWPRNRVARWVALAKGRVWVPND